MNEIKTIKDIDTQTWHEFKGLAARNRVKMGTLFKTMVYEYQKNNEKTWHKILSSGRLLNDEDAENLREKIKKMRKERGFRI